MGRHENTNGSNEPAQRDRLERAIEQERRQRARAERLRYATESPSGFVSICLGDLPVREQRGDAEGGRDGTPE